MPFIRKTDSQGSQPPTDTRKLFIGRTGELLFFVQNILKPEEPTHNIISIWGQGGVGKSTLLARFIEEARSTEFKDYCLTATVDELQTTPASIMEKFAAQLHMQGAFEKALKHYKETLRTQQTEREMLQDTLVQRVPTFAGAAVEGVPFVGPLLGEGVKATAEHLLDRRYNVQRSKYVELLEDPVRALTQAFVDELNQLVDTRVVPGSSKVRNRRVILFFDTFEQLATEAVPWLLNYFLPSDIKSNIVLVIAGRDPVERSIPEYTKHWLPNCYNETIYWIPLNTFTEDETRSYLIKRDITDPNRIARIWQLSQGLPLYLGLLTVNPLGKVDPMKDVVENFMRWIPEQEHVKRRLALDGALFSRPFNLDDLEAFPYISEQDRPMLYRWLSKQPFVRSSTEDGQYSYHDLAKELFSHHLYQHSRKAYYATRRALVQHYQQLIDEIQLDEGNEVYGSTEWLELKLALAYQLLLLPDEVSHINAIEQVLYVVENTEREQVGEIARVLREVSQGQFTIQISPGACKLAEQLLRYIEADRRNQERLTAATSLLETISRKSPVPTELLARIYRMRGVVYQILREYQLAMADFDHALDLNSNDPVIYNARGHLYRELGEYEQAIADFDHALTLNLKDSYAYNGRGWTYFFHKEYERAIKEFNIALELDANNTAAIKGRGWAYAALKEYQQAFADLDQLIELAPNRSWAYWSRGDTYSDLKEYHRAIADYDRAIELDPSDAYAYNTRAYAHLWLKNIKQAEADFTRSWEQGLLRKLVSLMINWTKMCQERPNPGIAEHLESATAVVPHPWVEYICQGVVLWLRNFFEQALAELEHAIELAPEKEYAYFWKGMVCVSLRQEEEAIAAIERSLELELAPILLTPLRWFEQDKPDFYHTYVVPLMARYDLL
jgi:tetratricopeptide (TPR) repeat protein